MYWLIVITLPIAVLTKPDTLEETYMNILCGSEIATGNTSCHFQYSFDDIPYAGDHMFATDDQSLFFVDSSCNGGLNFLQACSVEAAARAHPDRQIYVLFSGSVSKHCKNTSPLWELMTYPNVHIFRIRIRDFMKKTPLENLAKEIFVEKHLPANHIIDIITYIALYKFGGVGLNLGVLLVTPLNLLPQTKNWAGKEDINELGLAPIALSRRGIGKKISTQVLRLLKTNLQNNAWPYANVLLEILEKVCNTTIVQAMSSATCRGFEVYHPGYFYPIKYNDWKNFLRKRGRSPYPKWKPFAYHIWDPVAFTRNFYDDSLYALLMKGHCPRMYELMI